MTTQKRLRKEISGLKESTFYSSYLKIRIESPSLEEFTVFLKGPDETPYADYWFKFKFQGVYENSDGQKKYYPYAPPIVRLINHDVEHVNIMKTNGELCVDILGDEWSPAIRIITLFDSIRSLLDDPNFESAYNGGLHELYYREGNEAYRNYIRTTVEKHGLTDEQVQKELEQENPDFAIQS